MHVTPDIISPPRRNVRRARVTCRAIQRDGRVTGSQPLTATFCTVDGLPPPVSTARTGLPRGRCRPADGLRSDCCRQLGGTLPDNPRPEVAPGVVIRCVRCAERRAMVAHGASFSLQRCCMGADRHPRPALARYSQRSDSLRPRQRASLPTRCRGSGALPPRGSPTAG